ncbi:unnamed protein product [Leptidea sinapis]|uniref:Uncharacterized protein n=1 Tax=Leptidea sinapis TaxID=189913 RepID=A0A5E4Q8D7_9NEOP|nr:unnamed protein product [Leptidea sinapis]
MSENNLLQHNGVHNSFNKTLDLVLSNVGNTQVINCLVCLSKLDKYHPPLEISVDLGVEELVISKRCKRPDFFSADYDQVNSDLEKITWTEVLSNSLGVNGMVSCFYSVIKDIIKTRILLKPIKSNQYPHWYTRKLIKRVKEKEKYRIRFKKFGNPLDITEFKFLRFRFMIIQGYIHNTGTSTWDENHTEVSSPAAHGRR